ncbi:MAG: hypothetical protein ACQEWU_11945 [Bacillota bacterium]
MLENNQNEQRLKEHVTKEIDSIRVPTGLKEEMWTQVQPVRKKRRIPSKVLLYIATLACVAVLIPLGLAVLPFNSEPTPSDVVTTQEEQIKTIETVLQNALNGPDAELKQIFNRDTSIEDSIQYDKERFKEYFANDIAYMEFVNSYGAVLMIIPIRNEYTLQVKDIKFEKTDSKEIIYNFSVEVLYQKEGSEKSDVEVVDGQANLNEDHKIERILIRLNDLWNAIEKN